MGNSIGCTKDGTPLDRYRDGRLGKLDRYRGGVDADEDLRYAVIVCDETDLNGKN